MEQTDSPLAAVIKGALAGLVGGVAIRMAMSYAFSKAQQQPSPEQTTEAPSPAEDPREKLVRKVASGVFETELSEDERKTWAEILHWQYSAFWGVALGILQATFGFPLWFFGILFGTIVWLAGPIVMLPAMKLSPPQHEIPPGEIAKGWYFHVIFGLATAISFRLLSWGRKG